jgi:hypothetical protein
MAYRATSIRLPRSYQRSKYGSQTALEPVATRCAHFLNASLREATFTGGREDRRHARTQAMQRSIRAAAARTVDQAPP